jgi:uncharacterized protein involved in copper resistance
MSRHSIILSGMAVAALLALGTPPGRADPADPDVDGMDHSKLNHGVLGQVTQAAGSQQASIDKDVVGMDHSKLNHGVLGSAVATSDAPTTPRSLQANKSNEDARCS